MSISMRSPSSTSPISAAFGRFRRDMPDRKAGRSAGEAAVGDQGAGFAEPLRFQIAGRIEHLLHARPAARPLVADHDDVAGLDLAAEDALDRGVLAFENPRRPREFQDALRRRRRSSRCSRPPRGCRTARRGRRPSRRHGRRRGCSPSARSVSSVLEAALLAEGDLGRHAARRGLEEGRARSSLSVRLMSQRSSASPERSAHAPSAASRLSRPARSSSPRMAITPPAR